MNRTNFQSTVLALAKTSIDDSDTTVDQNLAGRRRDINRHGKCERHRNVKGPAALRQHGEKGRGDEEEEERQCRSYGWHLIAPSGSQGWLLIGRWDVFSRRRGNQSG